MKSILILALALCAPVAGAKPVEKPAYVGGLYYMPSGSMEPTLPLGARVWASPLPYQKAPPKRGDIALLQLPLALVSPGTGAGTTVFVKRIVAVPGDRVEMRKRVLWVNGQPQKEPFVLWRDESSLGPPQDWSYDMKVVGGLVYARDYDSSGTPGDWTRGMVYIPEKDQSRISRAKSEALPPGKFLVLGDHRSNSNDSHAFGLVSRAQIKAKVLTRLYPRPTTF